MNAGVAEGGWDVVYTSGVGSVGSVSNSVSYNLHWNKTEDGGTMRGVADNLWGMCKGNRL